MKSYMSKVPGEYPSKARQAAIDQLFVECQRVEMFFSEYLADQSLEDPQQENQTESRSEKDKS